VKNKPDFMLQELVQLQLQCSKRIIAKMTWTFQGTVATFYKWDGQICNLLVWNFHRIPYTNKY